MVGKTRPVVLAPNLCQVSLTGAKTKSRGFLDKGIFSVLSFSFNLIFSVRLYDMRSHEGAACIHKRAQQLLPTSGDPMQQLRPISDGPMPQL